MIHQDGEGNKEGTTALRACNDMNWDLDNLDCWEYIFFDSMPRISMDDRGSTLNLDSMKEELHAAQEAARLAAGGGGAGGGDNGEEGDGKGDAEEVRYIPCRNLSRTQMSLQQRSEHQISHRTQMVSLESTLKCLEMTGRSLTFHRPG